MRKDRLAAIGFFIYRLIDKNANNSYYKEVSSLKRNKKLARFLLSASLLTVFLAICPYLCSVAEAESSSDHACCESSATNGQTKDDEACCTNMDSPALLKSTVESSSNTGAAPLVSFVISTAEQLFVESTQAIAHERYGTVHIKEKPLYLLKDSLLI